MSKSMLMGLVAGIGVATAGGVLGYQFLGQQGAEVAVGSRGPGRAPRRLRARLPRRRRRRSAGTRRSRSPQTPKDEHRIAGTAIGAVVGGAIGKDVGDRDLTTAAGAAAGAFIGRKIQEEFQENRADERTTTTIERRCGPAGSAPR